MPNFCISQLHQFSKINDFLWVCWFLGKNLLNFVSLTWKLDNSYYHNIHVSYHFMNNFVKKVFKMKRFKTFKFSSHLQIFVFFYQQTGRWNKPSYLTAMLLRKNKREKNHETFVMQVKNWTIIIYYVYIKAGET